MLRTKEALASDIGLEKKYCVQLVAQDSSTSPLQQVHDTRCGDQSRADSPGHGCVLSQHSWIASQLRGKAFIHTGAWVVVMVEVICAGSAKLYRSQGPKGSTSIATA